MPPELPPITPHTIYLGPTHNIPLSRQGGECPEPEGLKCHSRSYHCGRCGTCSGYQGCHFKFCSVTKTDREFHFCCPGDCELEVHDATER